MNNNNNKLNNFADENDYDELGARYHALITINQLLHDIDDLDTFYRQIHQKLATLITADNFAIALFDRSFNTYKYVYRVDEYERFSSQAISLDHDEGSLIAYSFDLGEAFYADVEQLISLKQQNVIKTYHEKLYDYLTVPLVDQGIVIGLLEIKNYRLNTRAIEQDLALLTFVAQHINSAIKRINEQEQLKQAVNARTQELMAQIREREHSELLQESLFKISELSNDSTIEIAKFYNQVHNIVGQLINSENFFIAKYEDSSKTLNYLFKLDQNIAETDYNVEASEFYTELILTQKKTSLLTKQDILALHHQLNTNNPPPEIQSWLGVPLITDGEVLGAMVIQSYQPHIVYTEQDAEILNFVARTVSSAIKRRELLDFQRRSHDLLEEKVRLRTQALREEIRQRKKAEEQLTYSASHDSLTGLPNRTVLIDLLNHAIAFRKRRPELSFALLFLDLDRFKVVNDSLGHHAGDELLKIVSGLLKDIVREQDTVARLGGDEFVILIEDFSDNINAFEIADRITKLLSEPIIIENTPVFIGTSIGVLFSDDRYTNANVMLRDADTAMYHAKEKGKGRYEVFDTSMQLKVQEALTLEADIREAIQLSEFIPYFQPIVELSSNKTAGFEALVRWQSHKRGLVMPNDFITIAEENNLINAIDLQVLEKSCIKLKQWQKINECDDLYISCNLFCEHFFSPNLCDEISQIITRVGIKPHQLRLELTERALLDNSNIVLSNMQALKELGVKILLDDFGTGYSSLSYLHRFPIDVLKIDRSFISNIHDHEKHRAIIKTIIDLASNLNMSTVGEGIENSNDAKLLTQMSCEYGQGYYFAKPKPAELIVID